MINIKDSNDKSHHLNESGLSENFEVSPESVKFLSDKDIIKLIDIVSEDSKKYLLSVILMRIATFKKRTS